MTKKALLLLRLSQKSSFTISKLRFLSLRKPKNSSFYSNPNTNEGDPLILLGHPLSFSVFVYSLFYSSP